MAWYCRADIEIFTWRISANNYFSRETDRCSIINMLAIDYYFLYITYVIIFFIRH